MKGPALHEGVVALTADGGVRARPERAIGLAPKGAYADPTHHPDRRAMIPPGGGRPLAGAAKVRELMRRLGRAGRSPGRIYLVGGGSAVLVGWRETTVDVDLKLDPEPGGIFDAIARAKEDLNVNVELAAPDDFIPPLPGWRERSPFIARHGSVDFHHYDFYAQALAKLERGHATDRSDARAMARLGLIRPERLLDLHRSIAPSLVRFPAIDPPSFHRKVLLFADEIREAHGGGEPS